MLIQQVNQTISSLRTQISTLKAAIETTRSIIPPGYDFSGPDYPNLSNINQITQALALLGQLEQKVDAANSTIVQLQTLNSPTIGFVELNYIFRTKYGVSFHNNMDLKTMSKQWLIAVQMKPSIVTDCPVLAGTMTAAAVLIDAQDIANQAKTIAYNTFTTVLKALNLASAVLTGQVQYAGAEAAAIASGTAALLEAQALNTAKAQLVTYLKKNPCI